MRDRTDCSLSGEFLRWRRRGCGAAVPSKPARLAGDKSRMNLFLADYMGRMPFIFELLTPSLGWHGFLDPIRSLDRRRGPTVKIGGTAFRSRGIRAGPASTAR